MKLKIIFILFLAINIFASEDLKTKLDSELDGLMTKVIEWRHDIHQYPELGNREFRTSKKVADHLTALGIEVETGIAYTGVVGLIRGGSLDRQWLCVQTWMLCRLRKRLAYPLPLKLEQHTLEMKLELCMHVAMMLMLLF